MLINNLALAERC